MPDSVGRRANSATISFPYPLPVAFFECIPNQSHKKCSTVWNRSAISYNSQSHFSSRFPSATHTNDQSSHTCNTVCVYRRAECTVIFSHFSLSVALPLAQGRTTELPNGCASNEHTHRKANDGASAVLFDGTSCPSQANEGTPDLYANPPKPFCHEFLVIHNNL
jgi:hypothetical protein